MLGGFRTRAVGWEFARACLESECRFRYMKLLAPNPTWRQDGTSFWYFALLISYISTTNLCFQIYMLGLTLAMLINIFGVTIMHKVNVTGEPFFICTVLFKSLMITRDS
jgi:hypothetical protein